MIVSIANTDQRLVILLHGLGGSGSSMMPITGPWRRVLTRTKFVAPDAPFPAAQGGHQWFRVDGQEMRPDHIAFVRQEFDALIEGIVQQEGFESAIDQVAFVGLSQGAIMTLDAVGTGRWKVGALVTFAGLLPLQPETTSKATPVLLVHGEDDPRIPVAASKAAAGQLRTAGFDVSLEMLPGVGHTISPEGADMALKFLRQKFGG